MKRWSKRGSVAAHERMAQLRTRKLRHERSALITEWTALTRRDGREWTTLIADVPRIDCDDTIRQHIRALRRAILTPAP